MKAKLKIFLIAIALIYGCEKNQFTVNPEPPKEETKVEVSFVNETSSVIEFLTPEQTGIMTSDMMRSPGLIVLSYSRFASADQIYDTTFAYATFRDRNSPPINIGMWQERRGMDIGDVYFENFKLEKSERRMRMHHRDTALLGVEYRLKLVKFDFKHSSKHQWKIIDKLGREQNFNVETPDKVEFDSFPEFNSKEKELKLKLKTRLDTLNLILNVTSAVGIKPIMLIKVIKPKNIVKIDSTIFNLIPNIFRQNFIIFSVVQQKRGTININNYQDKVSVFSTSTFYFRVRME